MTQDPPRPWHKRCGRRTQRIGAIGSTRMRSRYRCAFCDVFPTIATLINDSPEIEATYKLGGPDAVIELLKDR